MRVLGITSKLPAPFALFFWEYDNTEIYDVLEEANFISQVFKFDVYVLESSLRNYHIVSFDVLTLREVNQIQNWLLVHEHYLTVSETPLHTDAGNWNKDKRLWNALRIGEKGKKSAPLFVKVFYGGNRLKSLGHYVFYRQNCGIPPLPKHSKTVKGKVWITIYNTGKGAKRISKDLTDKMLSAKARKTHKKAYIPKRTQF